MLKKAAKPARAAGEKAMMDFVRGLEAGEARPTESRSGPRGPGQGQGQGQSQGQGQGQRGALHASKGGRDDDDYNDTFIYDDEVRLYATHQTPSHDRGAPPAVQRRAVHTR